MSISVTGIIWYALIYMLTNSGYIKDYPGLYNKGLPLYYLIAPCFYLYIRGSLTPAYAVFRKIDLLHFLIAIPGVISIIPYTFLSAVEQQIIVNQVVADVGFAFGDSKYIVGPWHWFAFPISACIYTFVQFLITFKQRKQHQDTQTIKWIYLFTAICGLLFIGMLIVNFTILNNLGKTWTILHSSKIVFAICFCLLILSALFFLNPEFLYGFVPQEKVAGLSRAMPESKASLETKDKPSFDEIKIKLVDISLVEQFENFIKNSQIFKKTGLTLSELASVIEVPNHKLSDLFNNHYNLNFNTYINNLRINYVKNRLDTGDWKQFTLEAIANDAGFSSRNTFFVAFKKVMDVTPSAYLSTLKDKAA
ncbi:helix-turn-helix transcriptional regulator [Pedobacter nototheniae]|uniref:helix-turn-helix domain-containing protein n=1 Tax=Pedobacter nototheniae TaxID=2488994 RepID=UPI002931D154|nr:helix-turn-helix transcriptional regulator [Pedobacter nototheniae]